MFVAITNTPRDYAWGSTTAIASLLGREPSGRPQAELWLGAHPGSPSVIVNPEQVGGARDLAEWIAGDASAALGTHPRLPFLLKVLAAAKPLSLQAHPTATQAEEGFARENALGIPLDAPNRNYKDAYPKPEVVFAISEKYEALCGFRPIAETRELLEKLGLDSLAARLDSLPAAFEWLITRGDGVDELIERVTALAAAAGSAAGALPKTKDNDAETASNDTKLPIEGSNSFVLRALHTVRMLTAEYPGDPGIVISLLLNRVTLRRGEALYLPAGNIHAYLDGLAVELMVASDNVLRGGLTPKHVDVAELLNVLDFTTTPVPYIEPVGKSPQEYRPEGTGFTLVHVTDDSTYELTGPGIALCTSGSVLVTGAGASARLSQGEATFITPDEGRLQFSGSGELFLATTA